MPQSLFHKVESLRTTTLLKKTLAQVFSCEFCEIFKNTFFTEHHRATTFGLKGAILSKSSLVCESSNKSASKNELLLSNDEATLIY